MARQLLFCLHILVLLLSNVVSAKTAEQPGDWKNRIADIVKRAKEVGEEVKGPARLAVVLAELKHARGFSEGLREIVASRRWGSKDLDRKIKIRVLRNIGVAVIEFDRNASIEEMQTTVTALRLVEGTSYVEPDELVFLPENEDRDPPAAAQFSSDPPVNDPLYKDMWGLEAIRAPEAWKIWNGTEEGGYRPKAVINDSAMDCSHEDLRDTCWVNEAELNGVSGVDDDNNGYVDDIYGWDPNTQTGYPDKNAGHHGHHIGGTIGATGNNGIGVTGVHIRPWLVNCSSWRGNNGTHYTKLAECFDYAVAVGADVVNCSWSTTGMTTLKVAIQRYGEYGGLTAVSAANVGKDNDIIEVYPVDYGKEFPTIITVAALGDDEVLDWSNYGVKTVHLAAPGTGILSTSVGGGYEWKEGTSMAAPHVAGAIALMRAYNSSLTVADIRQALQTSAKPCKNCAEKVMWGKLDLAGAMEAVIAMGGPTTTTTPATTTTPSGSATATKPTTASTFESTSFPTTTTGETRKAGESLASRTWEAHTLPVIGTVLGASLFVAGGLGA